MQVTVPRGFLLAEGEARYDQGEFILPEEEEEEIEEDERKEFREPNTFRKFSAKVQARAVTGLLALLQAIFKVINYLLTVLSKIV